MAVKVLGAFKRDQNDRQEQRRAKPTHTAAHYKKRRKKKSNLPLNFKTTHENFYLIAHYFSGKETKTKTEHFSLLETSKEMGVIANAVELFLR